MSQAELFAAHHGEVRALARRMLRDPADAEDAAATTFALLPAALPRMERTTEARSFVYGVCANVARRVARATTRRHAVMERAACEPGAVAHGSAPDDPETAASRRELLARLSDALSALPDEQRTAFLLTSVEERSAAEVAELCGVPEATVRTRLFHARRKLRAALTDPEERAARLVSALGVVLLALVLGGTAWAVARSPAAGRLLRRAGAAVQRVFTPAPRSIRALPPAAEITPTSAPTPPVPATPLHSPLGVNALLPAIAPAAPRAREALSDEEPLALFARAHRLHFVARRYDAALRAWDRYLETLPRGRFALEARYNRAIALARLGRLDAARAALAPFARGAHGVYRRDDASTLLTALERAPR